MTNVEGVLDRIAQAIKIAVKDGDEAEKENGRVLLETIECIKAGRAAGHPDHPGPNGKQRACL